MAHRNVCVCVCLHCLNATDARVVFSSDSQRSCLKLRAESKSNGFWILICVCLTHHYTAVTCFLTLYSHWWWCVCVCAAYGGSLIEHCLMAVGLPGLCKVDQFDIAQGKWFLLINVIMVSYGKFQKESKHHFVSLQQFLKSWRPYRWLKIIWRKRPTSVEGWARAKTSSFSVSRSFSDRWSVSVCPLQGLHHTEQWEEAEHVSGSIRGRAADVWSSYFIMLLMNAQSFTVTCSY